MIINAKDFGLVPGCNAAKNLTALFKKAAETEEEKTIIFEKGDYFVEAEECETEMFYITNTAGDREYNSNETPHKSRAALSIKNVKNLKIEGNGAKFIINGQANNAAVQDCENIEIDNIEFAVIKPDLHELKVINKTAFYVDFEIDEDSDYEVKDSQLYFKGLGYNYNAIKKMRKSWYPTVVKEATPNRMKRVRYLFLNSLKCRELAPRRVRIYYITTRNFELNDRYYAFDNRRQYVGIFVDKSKNISIKNIKQRFNYSLAFVAQDTENIKIDSVEFAPDKDSKYKMISIADFIQICMCRGDVSVTNSYFEGASDDCLNAHGMHYKIKKVNGNTVTVSYMHPQSHGYNPLRSGDEIVFVKPISLTEAGGAKIVSSKMISEYQIELQLDDASGAKVGDVIEDITACPNVYFADNTVNRISTRGLLLTTRGRVVVENNRFISTGMSGVLFSDDAISWYESGPCKDVTIQNNIFDHCAQTPILIKPENLVHQGYIHENIRILNNEFRNYEGECVSIKSSRNITIKGNKFATPQKYKASNSENIVVD